MKITINPDKKSIIWKIIPLDAVFVIAIFVAIYFDGFSLNLILMMFGIWFFTAFFIAGVMFYSMQGSQIIYDEQKVTYVSKSDLLSIQYNDLIKCYFEQVGRRNFFVIKGRYKRIDIPVNIFNLTDLEKLESHLTQTQTQT